VGGEYYTKELASQLEPQQYHYRYKKNQIVPGGWQVGEGDKVGAELLRRAELCLLLCIRDRLVLKKEQCHESSADRFV
jgi:hypothetical protein